MRVCLAQEHNTVSSVRDRTWSALSRVERANHEATAPPTKFDAKVQDRERED